MKGMCPQFTFIFITLFVNNYCVLGHLAEANRAFIFVFHC